MRFRHARNDSRLVFALANCRPFFFGHGPITVCLDVRPCRDIISVMRNNRLSHKLRLLGIFCALLGAPAFAQDATWEHELTTWRAQHVADLLKPAGWLSLTGLEWLQTGGNSFGAAADNKIRLKGNGAAHLGILRLEANSVELLPPRGGFPPAASTGRPAAAVPPARTSGRRRAGRPPAGTTG